MAACGVWSGCRGQVAPDVKDNQRLVAHMGSHPGTGSSSFFRETGLLVPAAAEAYSCAQRRRWGFDM
jgi:hypothetical protein